MLDTTQKLNNLEDIKRSLDKKTLETAATKAKVSVDEDVREMLNVTTDLWQHQQQKNLFLLFLGKKMPDIIKVQISCLNTYCCKSRNIGQRRMKWYP